MCGRADPASPVTQVSTTIGFKGVKTVQSFLFVVILLKVCFCCRKDSTTCCPNSWHFFTRRADTFRQVDMFRPTIGQLYQSAESAAASITILTAVVFQFSSSGFGFQVSSLGSGSSIRISAKLLLQGWFASSRIQRMILPSVRQSLITFAAIQKISWRTGVVQLFCCLLERRVTLVPSGSSCGGLSSLSPFSPSSPSSFSLS